MRLGTILLLLAVVILVGAVTALSVIDIRPPLQTVESELPRDRLPQ
jgi:hypothetical protein